MDDDFDDGIFADEKELPPGALPLERVFRDGVASPVVTLMQDPKLSERHRQVLRDTLEEMAKQLCFLRFSLLLGDGDYHHPVPPPSPSDVTPPATRCRMWATSDTGKRYCVFPGD